MVNKIFYMPNLGIKCYRPAKFQVRNFSGVTCFVADSKDAGTVQHSITDDLCKNIITRVFEIGERLKEAGRFEGKALGDMYSFRTLGGKKLLITDEDYLKWSGITPGSLSTLTKYVEKFMYDFGMLNLWPVIDRIMLVGNKENINIKMRDEEGGILEVSDRWGYLDKVGYHEVQPLLFILEYIARLYLHHTIKDENYIFNVELSCSVNYLGEEYDMGFRGLGLDLFIDLAYLHAIADPNMELDKCKCGTWFCKNILKKQKYCSRKCTSRFNTQKSRRKQEKQQKGRE